MAKLIWNRCPNHRMDMKRGYDDEQKPFYYCHICGFYRYHGGSEGYNKDLISKDDIESKSFENLLETGPLCPQCKDNHLVPFQKDGWYCSRCKYRS